MELKYTTEFGTLSHDIQVRIDQALMDVLEQDKIVFVSFDLPQSTYGACNVNIMVSNGQESPYEVDVDIMDSNNENVLFENVVGCEDLCNLHDQIMELAITTCAVNPDSFCHSNFETDIVWAKDDKEFGYDPILEVSTYYGGHTDSVHESDLVLIERSLINQVGTYPANTITHKYQSGFDQTTYIPAHWGRSVNNYILVEL